MLIVRILHACSLTLLVDIFKTLIRLKGHEALLQVLYKFVMAATGPIDRVKNLLIAVASYGKKMIGRPLSAQRPHVVLRPVVSKSPS